MLAGQATPNPSPLQSSRALFSHPAAVVRRIDPGRFPLLRCKAQLCHHVDITDQLTAASSADPRSLPLPPHGLARFH
ncbi:hypothetical protein M0R45_030073 [Rubus argutus]|uniref:Uncharacterized protein n=1 Tax=Rubus argutus TaxID=59490 RepID=A0AAW1WD30_RUBAR